jgi:prepilin-type N-terminal cleavage/methylation domain-containing protein
MPRSGFTLMELMLVLLIVILAAGLVVPYVDSLLQPSQVTAAIDEVRVNWEQARGRAMEEGRPYRFSIVEGGDSFRIEPDDMDTNPEKGYEIDGILPEGCLFVGNESGLVDVAATPAKGGTMVSKVVFLPDGTAREDVDLSFGRPGLPRVTLRLRALTGNITQLNPNKAAPR